MTYNFDPDKWYENEFFLLQSKLKNKEISKREFDRSTELLEIKLEQMWRRLDGTYQITPDDS